jgi:hypothetical protein
LRARAAKATAPHQADAKALDLEAAEQIERLLRILDGIEPGTLANSIADQIEQWQDLGPEMHLTRDRDASVAGVEIKPEGRTALTNIISQQLGKAPR